MKAIIFGANGQDGYYLTQLLESQQVQVTGVSRQGNFLRTDITDLKAVSELIQSIQPDYIFHLAANSTTRHEALFENHASIATGTLVLLEAVRLQAPHCKVFISGSGLQFENHNRPIKETDPFEARDAYSIARIQSVYAARYFRRLGLSVYVGYFFNHDSPRRSERHMAQRIAAAVRRIAAGSNEVIEVGDVEVVKEWTFAGDVVKGIWLLVNQEQVAEANISSGLGYSILDWIKVCFEIIGKDYRSYIKEQSGFQAEYRQLVSDASLIQSLGFQPSVSFRELAHAMIYA